MNNVAKNLYLGGDVDTILNFISEHEEASPNLGIDLPQNEASLNKLYKTLYKLRNHEFFFILPEHELPVNLMESVGRFFFLPHYCHKDNAPMLISKGAIHSKTTAALETWCNAQGFDSLEILMAQEFTEEKKQSDNIIYVSVDQENKSLHAILDKIVKMEWLSPKIILHISDEKQARSLVKDLQDFITVTMEQNPGIYEALTTISKLENELRKSESVIRFLEMELSNQKLYNRLIRGEEVQNVKLNYNNDDQIIEDLNKLKNDSSQLLTDLGRLRNDLAWYKRTFEERSFMGILKDRILRTFKQRRLL